MSITTVDPTHPLLARLAHLGDELKGVRDVQPVFLTTTEKAEALRRLVAVESGLAELKLRTMAAAGDVAEDHGARDVAAWLAHATRTDPRTTRAEQQLATALDTRWSRLAAGLADAVVNTDQARVIAAALADLPTDLDPTLVASAEETLVGYATEFGPADLRRLGRRILDVVAPDIADAELAKKLEREEARARIRASIRQKRLGDGLTRTTITHPDAGADRLRTYLEAFASPRHTETGAINDADAAGTATTRTTGTGGTGTTPTGTTPTSWTGGDGERIPYHRRLGHAFAALLEHLDPANLPAHGGDATTIMVTLSLDDLRKDLATAGILRAEDTEISAAQARRLACTANIIPVVLGGQGEILDLGRTRRLFTKAQRKALRLRDKGCRAEGCDHPATWTEAHHLIPWSQGGNTDIADGILLCPFHHYRAHDPRYTTTRLPNGDLRFHRRT